MKYPIETEPPIELSADEAALLREMPELDGVGQSRRTFMISSAAGGVGLFADDLTDEQLAAAAHVWRRKAFHGDKHASSVAARLERELQRRAGVQESEPAFGGKAVGKCRRSWWRFWHRSTSKRAMS
ncbi:hypothetical protein [Variovorax sp. LjRoot178]|uniref:hypothetical protein n=1 Tax=Variovorax sp. LjRoot178 TaxID=3342277 RepID=UPI003ECDDDE0